MTDLNELAKQLTDANIRLREAKARTAVAEAAEMSATRERDIIADTILREIQAMAVTH